MDPGKIEKLLEGLSSKEKIALLNETREHFESQGKTEAVSRLLLMLGREYCSSGNYIMAAESYRDSAELFNKSGDEYGEAVSLNNLAFAKKVVGDHKGALEDYDKALDIYRRLGGKAREAVVLSNIGMLYFDNGEYLEAIECFEDALLLSEETMDKLTESSLLIKLANAYSKANDHNRALEALKKTFEIKKLLGDNKGIATAVKLIAGTYLMMGESEEAEKFVFDNALLVGESKKKRFQNKEPNPDIFGMLNTGTLKVKAEKVNLSDAAASALNNYSDALKSKNINSVFKSSQAGIFLSADKRLLTLILSSLISHAIKFTPEGKNIYVYVGSDEEKIRCEIIDEAPGEIQKEFTDHGTDLFAAKGLTEKMGGNLRSEGMLGKGNTLVLEFPE